ncbi:MAG: LuxR C-terminal-related transcriptional regulator [Myxococcota bacterium]
MVSFSEETLMEPVAAAMIDLVRAAYDLDVEDAEWLPQMMAAGLSILDHGLGVVGGVYTRPPGGGEVSTNQIHVASGPEDFALRQARVGLECPPEVQQACTRPGICATLSEVAGEKYASAVESWTRHHDYAKDALGLSAVDPDGQGVMLIAPLRERTRLHGRLRHRWQMLGAHLASGFRLRRVLRMRHAEEFAGSDLPLGAAAVLNPGSFDVFEAEGAAQDQSMRSALREEAKRVDRARGRLGSVPPEEALQLWRSLVEGQWSMIDWFDSDRRRFILALPNPPDVRDPRGLTERESQVATYAALGDSKKLICYRLGLSSSRVSTLLHSAMRKLGADSHAALATFMLTDKPE